MIISQKSLPSVKSRAGGALLEAVVATVAVLAVERTVFSPVVGVCIDTGKQLSSIPRLEGGGISLLGGPVSCCNMSLFFFHACRHRIHLYVALLLAVMSSSGVSRRSATTRQRVAYYSLRQMPPFILSDGSRLMRHCFRISCRDMECIADGVGDMVE